jgi:hypothetical protein
LRFIEVGRNLVDVVGVDVTFALEVSLPLGRFFRLGVFLQGILFGWVCLVLGIVGGKLEVLADNFVGI